MLTPSIFKYFLLSTFALALFKGAMKGATSELISLVFMLIGLCSGYFLYKPSMRYMMISGAVFLGIYNLGLFISYTNRRSGMFEMLFGIVIALFKFFLLLTIVTAIAMKMDVAPSQFLENDMVQLILNYAKLLHGWLS